MLNWRKTPSTVLVHAFDFTAARAGSSSIQAPCRAAMRQASAGAGDVGHAKAGAGLEHFHRPMHGAVVARAAAVVLAGLALEVGDELGQVRPRRVGAHRQHRGVGGEARDGLELVQGVGRLALEQAVGLGQDGDG